jgi:hypothetical protein
MRCRVNVFNCYPNNDTGTWLPSRCLAMYRRSDSDIPAFMRHATISQSGKIERDVEGGRCDLLQGVCLEGLME